MADLLPNPNLAVVLAALRTAAPRLYVDDRVDLYRLRLDPDEIREWLANCEESEVVKSELDYEYPDRNDWIVVLRLDVDDEEYYVKVALHLPDMTAGRLIQFKPWVD